MSDLIDRNEALTALRDTLKSGGKSKGLRPVTFEMIWAIKSLPSAEPEAKPPKWVAEDRYMKNHFKVFPHCPQCDAEVTTGQCYCMICGQHIDWSEDDG